MATPDKPLDQMTAQERLVLGRSYFKEGKFDEAIKALSSIRQEEADPETYAWAQFNLGNTYDDLGKLEQAIKTWSNISHDDNPETYAWAQFNLGNTYAKSGELGQAITAWLKVRHDDDPKTYAWAQFNLGNTYAKSGELGQAITAWLKVRHDDDPETYARAQFNLGNTYDDLGKLEQAIKTWSNISHDDNPETYAQAQLNLGNTYDDLGKLEQAIETWSNISHDDNPETYAWAQFNLGLAYKNQDELGQAIETWSNISHDDNPETYAWAQLNLGLAYKNQDELGQAIETWSNISHDDDPETYAWAQLNLGNTYAKSGELGQAIETWSNISHDDDPETYAWAQFNLGNTYAKSGELGQAITAWLKVRHDDDPETYARAQLNLGVAYEDQGNLDKAITAWSNIHREDNPKAYARAQLNLGKIYAKSKKVKEAKEAYRNAREFFYYEGERGYRIHKCPPEVIKKLRDIAKNTDEVLKSLQIIPDFESQVAHYSRASTAFTLLEKKRKDQKPSHFRLSTIRGVNDPTEGLVLGKYWAQQGISETIHTNDTATFISCFTFNHDSLNQFRLYGKENGQEATGISLVFKEEFFSAQSDTLEFIAAPSIDPPSKLGKDSSNETEKSESNKLIEKSTLYRCIYLDPETWYWTLAQRDKSTFYRENKKAAKDQWDKYSTKISGIKGSVKNCLFDDNNSVLSMLKSISKELEESNAPEESHTYSIEEKQKILEAIRFILLPLQYLVKHIAFQEEQECRIMYITQFRDEKIHSDREKQWMYVEYEEPVLPHIDKIWLSPGAAKDQDFFRILLDQGSGKSKVRISQNPFRNKE